MKKLLFMLGLPILLISCQDEALEGPANGDGNVTFEISTSDMLSTRADQTTRNSAAGGLTNVDMTKYDLRYQLAIYRYEDDGSLTEVITPQTRSVSSYAPVTYNMNLTAGKTYKAVAWADFVEAGSETDLHYDTSNLEEVKPKEGDDTRLNDESRDAYAICQKFEVSDANFSVGLTLKRMLGKLRIVTTDWELPGVIKPDQVSITYTSGWTCESIDVLRNDDDGYKEQNQTEHPTFEASVPETKFYSLNYDAADNNCTILTDYIMRSDTYNSPIHFIFKTYKDGVELTSTTVDTDIPTRANWLTTVLGNFLSSNTEITVECDDMFEDEYNYFISDSSITAVEPESVENTYYVDSAAKLLWIQENVSSLSGATVELTGDIDLDGMVWTPINSDGNISTFEGNGHTIYNLYCYQPMTVSGALNWVDDGGLFGSASKIVIQNVNMQNVTVYNYTRHVGGIIGELGTGGSDDDRINEVKNCKVNNFIFRAILTNNYQISGSYNAGGIVGILNHGKITDCTATDIDLENGWRAGGIVGFVHGDGNFTETTISGCKAENVTVWNKYDAGSDYDSFQFMQLGSIVGCADGTSADTHTLHLSGCSASNITYKWFGYQRYHYDTGAISYEQLYELHNGDEGGEYWLTYDGRTVQYGPQTEFVGYPDKITLDVQ